MSATPPKRGLPPPPPADLLDRSARELGLGPEPVVVIEPAAPIAPPPPAPPPAPEPEPEPDEAPPEIVVHAPRAERRKLPKNRTGTAQRPYPTLSGRDTIKTGFNLDAKARAQLEMFFGVLPPGSRNLWAERVLIAEMRRTLRRWERTGKLDRHPLGAALRALLAEPEPAPPEVEPK